MILGENLMEKILTKNNNFRSIMISCDLEIRVTQLLYICFVWFKNIFITNLCGLKVRYKSTKAIKNKS